MLYFTAESEERQVLNCSSAVRRPSSWQIDQSQIHWHTTAARPVYKHLQLHSTATGPWLVLIYTTATGPWLVFIYTTATGPWLVFIYTTATGHWLVLIYTTATGPWLVFIYTTATGHWLVLIHHSTEDRRLSWPRQPSACERSHDHSSNDEVRQQTETAKMGLTEESSKQYIRQTETFHTA